MIMIQDGPMPTGVDKPLRITGDPYKVQVCVTLTSCWLLTLMCVCDAHTRLRVSWRTVDSISLVASLQTSCISVHLVQILGAWTTKLPGENKQTKSSWVCTILCISIYFCQIVVIPLLRRPCFCLTTFEIPLRPLLSPWIYVPLTLPRGLYSTVGWHSIYCQ